jgi:hypothetical protein
MSVRQPTYVPFDILTFLRVGKYDIGNFGSWKAAIRHLGSWVYDVLPYVPMCVRRTNRLFELDLLAWSSGIVYTCRDMGRVIISR